MSMWTKTMWLAAVSGAALAGAGLWSGRSARQTAGPGAAVSAEPTRGAPARRIIGLPADFKADLSGLIAACWDKDNPPSQAVQDEINSMYTIHDRYNASTRWSGSQGDPRALSWSLVPDGLNIPIAGGISGEVAGPSILFSRMDSLFAARGGRATWVTQITNCFARWEALSGVSYTRITVGGNDWDDGAAWGQAGSAGLRGDIRIASRNIDGGSGILAYNGFPPSGDMLLDSSESWSNFTNSYRLLRNTVMHEHGHGLGFAHVCPQNSTKLMEPGLNTNFDGPQQDEIRGVQRQYGDPYEPNNSAILASDAGVLAVGSPIVLGTLPTTGLSGTQPANASNLSIDANGEQDWFRFSIAQPVLATISVIPIGSSYDDSDQAGNGSCNSGNVIDATARANLVARLVAGDGGTAIQIEDSQPAGGTENITNVLLGPPGNFHLAVYESDAPSQSQLYRVTINVTSLPVVAASDGTFSDKVAVTWTAIPGAVSYQVYRNTINDGPSATVIGSPVGNSFDDTTAVPGVTYYYWARAFQNLGPARDVGLPNTGFRSAPVNNPPVANAGPNQNLNDNDGNGSEPVTLNGSASTDDGTIVNYTWTEGLTTLSSSASPTANVVLPNGVHTVTLTVTDNGALTGSDTVVIDINNRPTANAGPDQIVSDDDMTGSETVTLSGGASTDIDGTISTYTWTEGVTTLATGPSSSANVNFAIGVHTVVLTVTDNRGATNSDTVIIDVQAGTPACPPDFNDDGFLDFFDLDAYVACFEGTECPPGKDADYNHDGFVDFFDLDQYVADFEAGC